VPKTKTDPAEFGVWIVITYFNAAMLLGPHVPVTSPETLPLSE
jgi:hypothetical protein